MPGCARATARDVPVCLTAQRARPTWRGPTVGGSAIIGAILRYLSAALAVLASASSLTDPYWRYLADRLEDALQYALPPSSPKALRPSPPSFVVSLGFRMQEDGSVSRMLAQRVTVARTLVAKLARTRQSVLVLSGGVPKLQPNHSEAEAMLWYSRRCDTPLRRRERVLLEPLSHSTRENAVESVEVVAAHVRRHASIHVVTSRFHLPRACRAFTNAAAARMARLPRVRLRVYCAPVPPSSRGAQPLGFDATAATTTSTARAETEDEVDDAHDRSAGYSARTSTWCAARRRAPDPREVVWMSLREWPALLLYAWRGWM